VILLLSTSDTDLLSARASGVDYRWGNPSRLLADDVPELVAELRQRSDRIHGLEADLAAARRAPVLLADSAARLEKAALAKLRTLREALAGSPDVAREIYLTIFPGGLRFRPTKGSDWEIMGVLETGKLLPIEHTSCSDPTGNRALVRPRQVCVRPRLYAHPA